MDASLRRKWTRRADGTDNAQIQVNADDSGRDKDRPGTPSREPAVSPTALSSL
jgi:hypothetical protein